MSRFKSRIISPSLIVLAWALSTPTLAQDFNVPSGDLKSALDAYIRQSGVTVVYSPQAVSGIRTKGVKGAVSPGAALTRVLSGTGFTEYHTAAGEVGIVHDTSSENISIEPLQLAQAAPPPRAAVETVTVTSSKLGGADVQSIPIAITALSQEQLTATQTAGGPDLIKQVPNMTFTKTNFTGYSIQLRGIGTQAISVTTDPAVAVSFNDVPFIRNHFFEQEFYDVSQVEVLRGPQGTLYGRNATAGVVNLVSAKPTDQFEAMASGEIGSYHQRRFEGMINLPIVDDRLDIRLAGEWTKRQGYSFNELTNQRIDGRDLWSGRLSIGFKPVENLQMNFVWEHFSEDDDRMRTAKQLCKTQPDPVSIGGAPIPKDQNGNIDLGGLVGEFGSFSQGCQQTSLYAPSAFEYPNQESLPYITALGVRFISALGGPLHNAYSSPMQSQNFRIIDASIEPNYKAKNDTVELNSDYQLSPSLTVTSQTAFNNDFLWSTEDYNRFSSAPGVFSRFGENDTVVVGPSEVTSFSNGGSIEAGTFCDPQLGCSDRIIAQDLSDEHAWQFNQEVRLTSNFSGPFNFSVGGNYLHYETEENYHVFINALTLREVDLAGGTFGGTLYGHHCCGLSGYVAGPEVWTPGVSDNHQCLPDGTGYMQTLNGAPQAFGCVYIDPNPVGSLNNQGRNYFLSQNPYTLNSYAGFGEANYSVLSDLKLTAGIRWTEDQKHFVDIPSELVIPGYGYPIARVVNQQWDQFTGRAVVNWTPKLDFTDQTLVYSSYSHGYKAGGANPPGAELLTYHSTDTSNPIHPLTFKPEFIDAFELGTKNTLLDGALTLNADVFYYNYENYQISEIVDRTAINLNFDAHVKGAEVEGTWEPTPGFRLNFAGGWEDTAMAKGSHAVDLMDRTAGDPNWIVLKPFPTQASNCIMPASVVALQLSTRYTGNPPLSGNIENDCGNAYGGLLDPVTLCPYVPNPAPGGPDCELGTGGIPAGYSGFDPSTAPNNGEGFNKNLSGNKLPNAPPFTVSVGAQYSIPLTTDWAGTLRGDYYWQDYSWARVFNDKPYDRLRGYTNINLTLIFTNQNGWQVMLYDKNIFNETAITGDFLNSDDSGLTTNVFLTDPKLIGIRVTKNW